VLLSRAGTFVPGAALPVASWAPRALADVDGDGTLDLVSVLTDVVAYRGNGDGTFREPVVILPSGSQSISAVTVADLDGDGRADVLAATYDGLLVARGAPGGAFAPPATFPIGRGARSVAVGDLDGDGVADVAVGNAYDHTVGVLRGTGGGALGAMRTVTAYSPQAVAIVPLAGAGRPASLLFRGALTSDLGIVDVASDGTPGRIRRWSTRGGVVGSIPAIAAGDLDGDLRPDVVLGAAGGIAVLRAACLP
jgi:hypothetical protein